MLKITTFLATTTIVNLGFYPNAVLAQSEKQCRRIEQKIAEQIQANTPALGSPGYNDFMFNRLPSALSQLQQEYPDCNIIRRRQSSNSEREQLRQSQQRRRQEFEAEQSERERQTNRWKSKMFCQNRGLQYDPANDECY